MLFLLKSEQFDLKEEERAARIERLEKEIVGNRLKDLLGESKYLDW